MSVRNSEKQECPRNPKSKASSSTPVCSNSSYYTKNLIHIFHFNIQQGTLYLRSTTSILTLILWLCLCKCFQVTFNQVCQFVQDLRSFQWSFWWPNWEGVFGSFDSSFHLKKKTKEGWWMLMKGLRKYLTPSWWIHISETNNPGHIAGKMTTP